MINLGTIRPGTTIRIPFDTFALSTGAPTALSNFAVGDILIYKDSSVTERASTTGYTATTTFDTLTGLNEIIIDLSSDATGDFFKAGSRYYVGISPVTADGQTMTFWAAIFDIGYPNAVLNTSIATLASQTSFTLTTGPAEDDALNNMWAIVHDKASAVQLTWVQILDYTGSTKTVTLSATPAATFTIAAIDNFSVMGVMPLADLATSVFTTSGTIGKLIVDTLATVTAAPTNFSSMSINASGQVDAIKIAGTTQTGLDLGGNWTAARAAKIDTINSDTDDIQTRLPAALVGGRMDSSVGAIAAAAITATSIAADAITDAKVASDVTIASVTGAVGSVTGAVGSVTGAVGSVTGAVGSVTGLTASNLDTTVSSRLAASTSLSEGYAADGAAPTLQQALFMILQNLAEVSISGTTLTVKKLDGSTTAMTFTLDSSTAPTSRTRTT